MSPVFLTPATRTRMVTPAILCVLYSIFFIGMSGLVIGWIPMSLSEPQWRFNAAVQLFGTGPQIALLLMLTMVTAVYGSHDRAVRWTAVIALLFAMVCFIVLPFFALDFLAARSLQPQAVLGRFTREGFRVLATSALLIVALCWVGWRGLKASSDDAVARRDLGDGPVVPGGQPAR